MIAVSRHWDQVRAALAAEAGSGRRLDRVEEAAFLPAALEIIERPVSPTGRVTARVLLAGMVATILWLALAKVDVVASAPGQLVPVGDVKLVQPAAPGIVRAIFVHDDQPVRRGQALVDLDPTVSTADVTQAQTELSSAQFDIARARATLAALDGHGFRFVAPEGASPALAEIHAKLARAELADIEGSATTRAADIRQAVSANAEASGQIAKLTETLPLMDVQIKAYRTLLDKGYVSRLRLIELERQRLATARDRDVAIDTGARARARIRSVEGDAAQARATARAQVLTNLARAEAAAELRRAELAKATLRSAVQRLRSPIDGAVAQLGVHTVGGVVEAAKPILVVVPTNAPLVAEVNILNRDIAFIKVGQPVNLKVTALPFTRYGVMVGRLESVSSDAVSDEKLGLVFRARVAITDGAAAWRAAGHPVLSGMEVVADVRTGRRSILSYLLSPINQTRQEAGRER